MMTKDAIIFCKQQAKWIYSCQINDNQISNLTAIVNLMSGIVFYNHACLRSFYRNIRNQPVRVVA